MISANSISKNLIGTKAIFLICGLGISSWAPMVPYAKERLHLNDANLGLLLLALGVGAISMMPVSGLLAQRYGSRVVMLFASLLMTVMLPLLLVVNSLLIMAIALFVFGAAVGTVDVAMNAHGVQVQNIYGKPVMSSFHGLFSVGGLLGSLGLGALIKIGVEPITAAIVISILVVAIVSLNFGSLLNRAAEREAIEKFSSDSSMSEKGSSKWWTGSVFFLGIMCFIVFLSEGAMLDWSAIFLKENRGVEEALAGVGYAAFSVAMATMRLVGDKLVSHFSGKTVVVGGSLLAATGIIIIVITPFFITSLIGFILLGIGAANIVPVFIGEGGRLKSVSALVAIPAITTMGYAGQLAGPALLGFIAHQFSLPTAFSLIAALLLVVAIAYMVRKNEELN
jgi:predicted MFS family arabinose efflux permease